MVDLAARFPDDILLRWMKVVQTWDAEGEIENDEEWVRRLQQAFASELDGVPLDVETVAYWRVLLRTQGPPLYTGPDGQPIPSGSLRPTASMAFFEDPAPNEHSRPSFTAWFAVLGASAGVWLFMVWGLDEGHVLRLPAWLTWVVFLVVLGAGFVFWARRRDLDFSSASSRDAMPADVAMPSSVPDTDGTSSSEDAAAQSEEGPMFWKCAECGNTVEEEARVCPHCGVEL